MPLEENSAVGLELGDRRQHQRRRQRHSYIRAAVAGTRRAKAHIVNTASIGGLQVNPNFPDRRLLDDQVRRRCVVESAGKRTGREQHRRFRVVSRGGRHQHSSVGPQPSRATRRAVRATRRITSSAKCSRTACAPNRSASGLCKAIENNEFYILTHSSPREWVESGASTVFWLRSTRRKHSRRELGITEPWRLPIKQ